MFYFICVCMMTDLDLDIKAAHGSVQALVTLKTQQKPRRSADEDEDDEEDDEEVFDEQKYVDALCTGSQGDVNSCRYRQTTYGLMVNLTSHGLFIPR